MRYLIRRDLFISSKEKVSIIQDMIEEKVINEGDGGKVYAIFKYLYAHTTRCKTVEVNLRMLIEGCGYKPRSGKNGMNSQFKAILGYLDNYGYLGNNGYDFTDIGLNDNMSIPMNNLLDIDKDNSYRNFVALEPCEEEAIRDTRNAEHNVLEAYYLTYKASGNRSKHSLIDSIGVSPNTARHYEDLLVESGLLKAEDVMLNGAIYKITNKINGKSYIGLTTQKVESRWYQHKGGHNDSLISKAINEYGVNNFTFKVIESDINDYKILQAKEMHYIDYYNTFGGKGYNLTHGAVCN